MIAKEIQNADPDLIGLQEAAHWFTGAPDGIPGLTPGATPATTSAINFLDILQAELAAIGAPYNVVASQNEANIEGITASGFDIRLLQRDVILVKKNAVDAGEASCGNVIQGNYANNLSFPLLGIPNAVTSTRGFVSADCTVNKRSFRFVNTHLEAFSAGFRALQAQQLVTSGPASTVTQKVVLVGDLNSDPSNGSASPPDPTPNNTGVQHHPVLGRLLGHVAGGQPADDVEQSRGAGRYVGLQRVRQRLGHVEHRLAHRPHHGARRCRRHEVGDDRARLGQPHAGRPLALRPCGRGRNAHAVDSTEGRA